MIGALNFKPYNNGAMRGFLDLRYHGLTIKGVRLMSGKNGLWLAFPQQKGEQDGETKWFDQMFLTKPEAEHIRRLVLDDLQAQGHLEVPAKDNGGSGQRPTHKTPEGEDVSEYYSNGADEDIPF
jgi:DNA-binding cell septation regulator SpoVG